MKKSSILILFLLPFVCYSQTHRFIYSYKFVADSTKSDSILYEETRLEIFDKHSEFVSDVSAKRDSAVVYAAKNNESEANIKLANGLYKNKVFKSAKSTYSIEYVGIQPFKVIQTPILNWKLTKETKRIQNYICQKANLNYGGREWEAWFTQEIPIQDGPYVFAKLPGLIVKLNDLKNQHSFLLIENYKTLNSETNLIEKPFLKPTLINKAQFNEVWNKFYKNPIGAMDQFMIINPGLFNGKRFDIDGNELNFKQQQTKEQKYAEQQLLHNNNYIDLDLYKVK